MGVHFHAPYRQFLGCYNNIIYVLVHPFMCIFIVIVILAKFHLCLLKTCTWHKNNNISMIVAMCFLFEQKFFTHTKFI